VPAPDRISEQSASRAAARRAWLVPLLFVAAAVLIVPVDLPVTRWITAGHLPKDFQKAVRLSEAFSHGFGATAVLIAVFVLDRAHRRFMPRLVAGTVLGGLLANTLKMFVSRTRPRNFDLDGHILDTFSAFFSWGQLPSSQEGFPSAHAATGFALAAVLSWRYPHGSVLFYTLAAVSGAQRVFSAAHFPSDVLFGAALGCAAGFACLPGGIFSGTFDRLEARYLQRWPLDWRARPHGVPDAADDGRSRW
jgi:membrane-associated phospholipid phosphatase